MSELPEVMDALRRLSFRTNAGCLELVYQEPWETSWGPEPEVLASVPLASLVAATHPPASVVERDARNDPQPGDVCVSTTVWTWSRPVFAGDLTDWQKHAGDKTEWFTREQWAARLKDGA